MLKTIKVITLGDSSLSRLPSFGVGIGGLQPNGRVGWLRWQPDRKATDRHQLIKVVAIQLFKNSVNGCHPGKTECKVQ